MSELLALSGAGLVLGLSGFIPKQAKRRPIMKLHETYQFVFSILVILLCCVVCLVQKDMAKEMVSIMSLVVGHFYGRYSGRATND
jgi:cell division protein FtsW (lipid II flippase)